MRIKNDNTIEEMEKSLVLEEMEYADNREKLKVMRREWESLVKKNFESLLRIEQRRIIEFDIDTLNFDAYRRSLNLYRGVCRLDDDSVLLTQIQNLEEKQSESIQRKGRRLKELAIVYNKKKDYESSIAYYKSAFQHMEEYQNGQNERYQLIPATALQYICLGVEYFGIAKDLLKDYMSLYNESKNLGVISEDDMKEAARLMAMVVSRRM